MDFENQIGELKRNLFEFYSTTDENRRSILNEWLTAVMNSGDSWIYSFKLLIPSEESFVQLFAVNCIYQNLTTKFREILSSTSSTEIENLREILLHLCQTLTATFTINSKLCACVAVFVLQTVPDVWSDPIQTLIERWSISNSSILMEVFSSLIVEFRKLALPLDRRNVVRAILRQNEGVIANCAAGMLQRSTDSNILADSAIRCIESWIEFDGANLTDWQQIIILCLNKINQSNDLINCVSKFFQNFVENSELHRMETFVGQLFDYATSLISFLRKFQPDDDPYEELTKMIVGLATNQTKILLQLLKSGSVSASAVIDFMLELSSTPGFYAVDESLSVLSIPFWYNLQEEATVVSDKEILNHNLTFVRPAYGRLMTVLPSKIQYPTLDAYKNQWSEEEKETFATYRIEVSDTFTCCYRVLGHSMTEHLLNLAKHSFMPSSPSMFDWRPCEAVVYVYESIGEYVTIENKLVKEFLKDIFIKVPLSATTPTLTNTVLRTISKYNHIICDDGDLLPPYVTIILPFLLDAVFVTNATLALRDLCSCRHNRLREVADSVVIYARKCFETTPFSEQDRLRSLSCVGLILSLQTSEVILNNLNDLLAPRLAKMQSFNRNEARYDSKNELLFEFDVVSTLVGSLSLGDDDQTEEKIHRPKPAFLVISESLELFKQIYEVSQGDVDVATKLCHALKGGILALMDELSSLIPKYCELILFVYDRPRNSCVVELAKSLFLMFANDEPFRILFTNVFERMLSTTASFVVDTDVVGGDDAVEAFLNFCYSLTKKNWPFFSSNDERTTSAAIELACRCLNVNDSTTVKESAAFICEFLKHNDFPVVRRTVERFGTSLMLACFERMKIEISTSCLEYLADIMFVLSSNYTEHLLEWRRSLPEHHLVTAMMKEIGNKRKFREFAKQINNGCRRNLISF